MLQSNIMVFEWVRGTGGAEEHGAEGQVPLTLCFVH